MVILVKFPWKSWIFMFLREKVEKSCNRTPGWVSRRAAKVLCLIRVWGGYLRPGVEFSPISPFWWKWAEFHHISWKWGDFTPFSAPWGGNGAWAAPERKHQRNLCFSYAFLGVLGSKNAFRGGFPPKTTVSGAFLVEITKMGGIPRNFTIFTKFPTFWCSPRPGPPRRHGIYMYYKGFCKVRREQEKVLILHILPRFLTFSWKITHFHEFLVFLWFSWKYMKFMDLRVLPRPGSEIACITALFYMFWGARFAEFPSFSCFSWNPLIFMKSP